jgi:hypothetical protein
MAQKIVIAELDIDIDALLKSTSDLKKEIDRLKNTQKDLAASGQSTSEAFIQNEAVLKSLNSAYASNVKAITESGKATVNQVAQAELLNQALNTEVTSIAEARQQNQLLNKLRNETNATTKEGQAQIAALNKKLDENNDFIKENADAYLKQKINIGNYSESIKEAFNNLNPLNGGLSGFIERSEEAGGAGNLAANSLGGMAKGFLGVAKASLAFIATPIGAFIAALVVVFGSIKAAMDRSSESTAKINKIFSIFSGVANILLKGVAKLGDYFINSYLKIIEEVGKKTDSVMKSISKGLKMLGFDGAAKSVDNFVKSTKGSIKAAEDLAKAEKQLENAQRNANLIQLKYQKDAEKLRQIRDDESKSIAARIKANEELGKTLQKQLNEELKIANLALKVSNLRIAQDGKTKETLDARAEALTRIADIEERITGQESEQLVNRNSLLKESSDKAKADLKTRQDNQKAASEKQQQELEKQAQAAIALANAELNLFLQNNKSKLEDEKFLTNELVKEEENRLRLVQEKKLANLVKEKGIDLQKLEQKKLSNEQLSVAELEYETARIALASETDNVIATNRKNLEQQLADERESQLLAQRDIDLQNAQSALEANLLFNKQAYEQELSELKVFLQNRKITKDQFIALERQAEERRVEMDRIARINGVADQLQGYAKLTAGLEGVFGKNKAIASATAAINGGLAVTEILKAPAAPFVEPFASIVRGVQIAGVAATTARSISQINSAKFEQGGIQEIGGKRHSAGGTKFYGEDGTMFEAERGEGIGILNRGAYAAFMDFNNQFGSGKSGGGMFAGGGIITQGVRPQSQDTSFILDAISSMPAPVVAVQEIQTVGNRYVNVVSNADF